MQPGLGLTLVKGFLCTLSAFILSASIAAPGGYEMMIWAAAGAVIGTYSSMMTAPLEWKATVLPSRVLPMFCTQAVPIAPAKEHEQPNQNRSLSPEGCSRIPFQNKQDITAAQKPLHGEPCSPCIVFPISWVQLGTGYESSSPTKEQNRPDPDLLSLEECSRILSQNMQRMLVKRKEHRGAPGFQEESSSGESESCYL